MTATHDTAVGALERSLAGLPFGRHPLVGLFIEHAQSLARGLGELEALTADELTEWNERLTGAESAAAPAEPMRDRARQLLEHELLADNDLAGDPLQRRERFIDMLQTLVNIGAVDRQQQASWTQRVDEAMPPPTTPPPPTLHQATQLRAVAGGPPDRIAGLRITSAELFADCVVIRWHLVIEEDPGWRPRVFIADHACDLANDHGPGALTDDRSTSYVTTPITIDTMYDLDWLRLKQTPEVLPGSTVFVPHVPPDATRLRVDSRAGSFEIDLRTAR